MTLIKTINDLKNDHNLLKHEQLVNGIIEAIDLGYLKVGEKLPSINIMVAEIGFARKTIVKAYEELKDRGLVESKKTKGYFVVSKKTNTTLKIALLMYSFNIFQEEFYNTFRKEFGERAHIDVFFHHNNEEMFETILRNISRKYGMFVVAPIQNPKIADLLKNIEPEKLIIVDRYLDVGPDCTYVTQEFENSTIEKLNELLPEIKKYQNLILFHRRDRDYAEGIQKGFTQFLKQNKIKGEIHQKYESQYLKEGTLYFCSNDSDLWSILKDAKQHQFQLGKHIGVLSYDDHIIKEMVFGGITTISTDFNFMAKIAAHTIKNRESTHTVIATALKKRNSL